MRILYVEDVLPNLYLIERVASLGKHTVINYPSAEQALACFDSDQPGLILADIYLEGKLDGLEFVRLLRRRGFAGPVFVVTAYDTPCAREASFDAGCDGFFTKPIQVRQLWRLIQQADPRPGP